MAVVTTQFYVLFSQTVLRLGRSVKSGLFTKPKKTRIFQTFGKCEIAIDYLGHGLLYLQDGKLFDVVHLKGEKRQILALQ